MAKYVDLIAKIMPTVFRGHFGERMSGFVGGLLWDILAEGASQAVKAPWSKLGDNPDDALPLLGEEHLLPAYPTETPADHRARIQRAWDDWPTAGSAQALIAQFAAAGYPGLEIRYYPERPGPGGVTPYWSQFWVWFPLGTHAVTGVGPTWGSFNYGTATLYGPGGITFEFVQLLRGIVRKWKPGHWICRGFEFELQTTEWGGFNYGVTHVYGGVATIGN